MELNVCNTKLDLVAQKEHLFKLVDRIYADNSRKRIQHVLNLRIQQLEKRYPKFCNLNLAAKTTSNEYRWVLKTPTREITADDSLIEKISMR